MPPNFLRNPLTITRTSIAVVLVVSQFASSLAEEQIRVGQTQPQSDTFAAAVLFQEQHLVDSGLGICDRAAQQSLEGQFDLLRSWVIPDSPAARFRITVDFVNTTTESARLVSPAHELVSIAGRLNHTDRLRTLVQEMATAAPTDQLDRLTLLALIAIESTDDSGLETSLDQWFQLLQSDVELFKHSTAGLVLLAHTAIEHGHKSNQIRELVRAGRTAYRAEYNRDAILRHLVALAARLESSDPIDSVTDPSRLPELPEQWHVANLERAFEHGSAFPAPLLHMQRGSYRNLSNYGDLFIYYQSPLLGNFSVEATATGFGYREAQLVVGGRWTGLVFDHKQLSLGNPRGELNRRPVTPPLNDTERYGFIRTRVDVQDQQATTWMNGRLVHQQPLRTADSPWVGVRTNYRVQGGADDLQITGEPTIPDQISLIESPELLGWYDYYATGNNVSQSTQGWEVIMDPGAENPQHAEIRHERLRDLPRGSHREQLLRYLRPFVEDGTIAYEFFYQPGQTAAHPAIGRTVFLLTETGPLVHRLTDGRFDRSGLRPDNQAMAEPSGDARPLPLLTNQWNRVEIIRGGAEFTIRLNGQMVGREPIVHTAAAPPFGIFHFADETALRVRDVTWAGKWPLTLPAITEQQLARPWDQAIPWTAGETPPSLHCVFDNKSFTNGVLDWVLGDPIETATATDGGVVIRQTSTAGYRDAKVAPVLMVGGDFDVAVSFDQIQLRSQIEMIATIQLEVQAATDQQDVARIQVVRDRQGVQKIQCLRAHTSGGQVRRSYFAMEPTEGVGGRLMISRRGSTVYYLAADNDSKRYRLVGQESFPTDDLQLRGIGLGVQAQGPEGFASTRFKEFSVRAERLEGTAMENRQQLLADLNLQRDRLPISFSHDFAKQPTTQDDFAIWTQDQKLDATEHGLEVVAAGTDEWSAAGFSIIREFSGDLDITFQFKPTEFPTPKPGQKTQVFLQMEMGDTQRTQVSSILTKNDQGNVFCQMQVRNRLDGVFVYKMLGSQVVPDADRLRIARRGKKLTTIAGSTANDSEVFLGSAELTDQPTVPLGVRLMLHTGGEGLTSKMWVRSIRIHAAQSHILQFDRPIRPDANVPQPQSVPSRIFNSLRGLFN